MDFESLVATVAASLVSAGVVANLAFTLRTVGTLSKLQAEVDAERAMRTRVDDLQEKRIERLEQDNRELRTSVQHIHQGPRR